MIRVSSVIGSMSVDQPLWSFELLGFRVQVWMTFVVLALVLSWLFTAGLSPLFVFAFIGVVFVSIITHELGHAVVARQLGLQVGAIQLRGLGGQVSHSRTTHANQLKVSLAGPGAGLLLAAAAGLVLALPLPIPKVLGGVLWAVMYLNVFWSVFNLLPILPMDGGNALKSGLSMMMSEREALKWAAVSTMVVAGLGAMWALVVREPFILLFLAFFGYRGWQMYQRA